MMTQTTMQQPASNPRSLRFWFILIGAVLILGGVWIGFNRQADPSATGDQPALPVVGSPAPEITLQNLQGETVSLSSMRGRPVLVNFWATWCGPCRVEMPEFQEAYLTHGDDLVILAVNATNQDNGDIAGFVNDLGLTFPILLDEEGEALSAYDVFAMPTSVFINRDGIIVDIFTGPINRAYIESKLSEL